MGEVADAYAGVRERVSGLVRDADPAGAVPACPDWTVKDVVAHVTGVVDDALAGRLDGVATDPWTQAQVDARRDRSLDQIIAEWDEKAPAFEAILDGIGPPGEQAVFDVATHEHDLRGALGVAGAEDGDAVRIGLRFVVPMFVTAASRVGALCIRTTAGEEWGADQPAPAVLTASRFELFRALSGRRSAAQLRGFDWSVDPEPFLPAFEYGPFCPAPVDIVDAPARGATA